MQLILVRSKNPEFFTTGQTFGDQLHTYTIVDAINDKNVLPFRVDYIKTMDADEEISDEMVYDINREKAMMAPQRIALVTKYILEHFDQKTTVGIRLTYSIPSGILRKLPLPKEVLWKKLNRNSVSVDLIPFLL